MARKIEQWVDNEGLFHSSELEALKSDLYDAIDDSNSEDDESPKLTSEVVAAIDALHEYAHRDELRTNLSPADPIFRHCGVQSGDNWARRVERLNLLIDASHGVEAFADRAQNRDREDVQTSPGLRRVGHQKGDF